jgi:predicted phosphodiesterase
MRYAIVSDLHANFAAWQTVLTDLADLKADQIVCLGDVVGYGPNPVEVLESVYRVVSVTLMGNHDAAVCGRLSTEIFSPRAATAAARHRDLLSSSALDWLSRLPLTYEGPGFRCTHSDFSSPAEFRYIVTGEDALPSWKATPEQLLFVGHSHLPGIYVIGESGVPHFVNPCDFELEAGKRYLINPGSVGYPRVGDRRSSYCLYDDTTRSILFRQLPFDSASYRQAMHGAGLDDDPWVQQKEEQQHLPLLRAAPRFGKAEARPPPAPKTRNRLAQLLALVAVMAVAAGVTVFHARRSAPLQTLAVSVPPFDLAALAAYPLTPPDKNLLPVLPPSLNPDGRLENWRYAFEDRRQQIFSTGLRDGATTLCINNATRCKAQLESPLIDLSGTGLRAVRLRGRIRKPEPFEGTVFYQLAVYSAGPDGAPAQNRVHPFEMRTPKRKLSTPGADRDVRIPIDKKTTHVRFRIDADFTGALEIEQPRLTADTKGERP